MKKFLKIAATKLLLAALASCGAADVDEAIQINWEAENPFYGETLTVGIVMEYGVNHAAFARAYMLANPGTTIEIINYGAFFRNSQIRENIMTQVGMQMMTGTAPDLMVGLLADYRNLNTAQLLADWSPVMDAHPGFIEDDWDMNFFNAMSVNGRLHAFPSDYSFNYIVANSQVPGLVEAFSQFDEISFMDMVELHRQFAPQDGSMFLYNEMNVSHVVRVRLHDFLDLENGFVDFNNQDFIDLITWANDNTPPRSIWRNTNVAYQENLATTRETELFLARHYLFRNIQDYFFEYFPVLEADTIFLNPKLLVDADRNLVSWVMHEHVLNAGATPAQQLLALDFMMFMSNPGVEELRFITRRYPGISHTNYTQARYRAETIFPGMVVQYFTGPFPLTRHQASVSREEAASIVL